MIIRNPKIRRAMNSAVDSVIFYLFLPAFAMAILGGTAVGFVERKYQEFKGAK